MIQSTSGASLNRLLGRIKQLLPRMSSLEEPKQGDSKKAGNLTFSNLLEFSEPMAAEENGSEVVELVLRSLIYRLGRVDGMRSSREKGGLIALL